MKNIYKDAGERILMMRVMRGYTREGLAELASISPKFLYEIENGKKGFSAWVLYNICDALKVDCDYIMTGRTQFEFDKSLVEAIQLFEENKTEKIANILVDIYNLL